MRRQVNWVRVVRDVRKKRRFLDGMTQEDVALRVGASTTLIGDLERGHTMRPGYEVATALLNLLDQRKADEHRARITASRSAKR